VEPVAPQHQGVNSFDSSFSSNQPSLRDLILDQAKINKSDKTMKSVNIKIETFSSTLRNQLSFNKIFETQLAQITATVPVV
jgi:hypothetical protein